MEITNIQTFLKYYSKIKYRTRRLLDLIPEDKLEWTYREGRFTLGDLVRHLALTERYMYAETMQLQPSSYKGCGIEYANGKEAVIALYDNMHQEAMQIFANFDTEILNRKCPTPGSIQITTWKWMRAMVEHEVHHRGQIYMYLGMLGVEVPPIFGLTAEEVAARGV
jgi:uncharacterized damage-inducible protein DinB